MRITNQDGEIIYAHDIEMQGRRIFCISDGTSSRDRVLCGEYADIFRTAEVFSELTYVGWNFPDPKYVMPKK